MRPPSTSAGHQTLRHPLLRFVAVCLVPFATVFDSNAVTIALPAIGQSLGLSDTELPWVITAVALPFGGLILAGGRIADCYGRRRVLQVGALMFAVASVCAAVAASSVIFIVARAAQGAASALAVPAALSLLTSTYREGAPRNRALAAYTISLSAAMIAAVALSGVLIQLFGWRSLFLVEAPLALAAGTTARFLLPADTARLSPRNANLWTAITATTAIVAAIYSFTALSQDLSLSLHTILPLVIASILAILAGLFDRRSQQPLYSPALLRRGTVSASITAAFVLGAAGISTIVVLSLYLQNARGYTPLQTGLLLVPLAVAGALASVLSPTLARRVTLVLGLATALLVQTIGILLLALTPSAGELPIIVIALAVLGTGHFSVNVFDASLGVTAIPNNQHGLAIGLLASTAGLGTGVGLTLLVTFGTLRAEAAQRAGLSAEDAAVAGFHIAIFVAAGLSLLAACCVPLLTRRTPRLHTG